MCVCVMCLSVYILQHTCGGQRDSLQEPVLSSYYVGPRDRTQVVSLGSKLPHLPSRLAGLLDEFFYIKFGALKENT